MLLVLDDAAGHDQVEPLLPGTAGCIVLVTSRRRLAALHDAAVISLDILTRDEALTCSCGWPGSLRCSRPIPERASRDAFARVGAQKLSRQIAIFT